MAWVQAMLAGLALVAACSSAPLKKGSDGGPDCTGLPAPAIACLVGPTVLVCALDQNGNPAWNVSCPGGNTGGAGGGGAGAGGGSGGAGGSNPDGGVVVPPPITFSLENGGATSAYIYVGCIPDLTITELSSPPIVICLPRWRLRHLRLRAGDLPGRHAAAPATRAGWRSPRPARSSTSGTPWT